MRLLFSFLFLTCYFANAENKLLLCADYDKSGNYTGAYSSWEIKRNGNYMYVFYKSDTPINDTLFLGIEKSFSRKDSNFYAFDQYYLVPDSTKKFAVNKYVFTKAGKYRFSVYDRFTSQKLNSYTTDINYGYDELRNAGFTDTWYYAASRVRFCDSISPEGKIIGQRDTFNLSKGDKNIKLYIEQTTKLPLKTQHLMVRIYSNSTHEFLTPYVSAIKEEWYWTYVPVYVSEIGTYTVELYNDDDEFINSRRIVIQ